MKKILLLCFAATFSTFTFSQSAPAIQWQKVVGGTLANYITTCIDTTADGSYVIGGYNNYSTGSEDSGFLAKFDASGSLVWKKNYSTYKSDGSEVQPTYLQINSVKHTTDGGFIAVGGALKDTTYLDYLWAVIKTNANGDTLWERNFDVDTAYTGVYAQNPGGVLSSVLQTSDGGYIATGYVGDAHGYGDFAVVKMDASGNIIWKKSYGGSGDDQAHAISQSTDGNYVITGYTTSGSSGTDGDVSGNHGGSDFWVIKTDTNGTLLWQNCFGGSSTENAFSIAATPDGGSVIAGYTYSTDGQVTNDKGDGDWWIIKITSAGSLTWEKDFGGSAFDGAYGVTVVSDGTIAVTGTENSADGDVTGNHGLADAWILQLDASGNLLLQKTIGTVYSEDGAAIIATHTGYAFGGINKSRNIRSSISGSPYHSSDYWLVSIDNSANMLWQASGGASGGENVSNSVAQAADGGFITAGYGNSTNGNFTNGNFHGGYDACLAKTDNTGALQWSEFIGGSNDDFIMSVRKTNDGGFIAAGSTASADGDVTNNKGNKDFWIVKLTAGGAISWQKTYGGSLNDSAMSIEQTTDGGYIVAGTTASSDGDVSGNHGGYDFWVIKLDASGNLTWQKTYGGSGDDFANSIQQTTDGGYIVAGSSTSSDGDVTTNKGLADYWVVKLDASGNIAWQKTYGGASNDICKSVYQTTDGKYIATGYTNSTSGDVTNLHGPYGYYDFWTIKLDASGNLDWERTYGSDQQELAYGILQGIDGNYITVGESIGGSNGDIPQGTHSGSDVWVTKTDTSGNIIWEQTYGGSLYEAGYGIVQASDGSYFLAGTTNSVDDEVTNPYGNLSYNIWAVDLAADVLPVTLLNFNGVIKNNSAVLSWQTSMEENNKGFKVQRSYDGTNFTDLGFVSGAGTSSLVHSYSYTDIKVVSGNNFYRLKQIDVDGKFNYSNVIKLDYSKFAWSILGNPVKNNATVELQLDKTANVALQLISVNGDILASINKGNINPGTYSISLNMSTLSAGNYFIKLMIDKNQFTDEILKQ